MQTVLPKMAFVFRMIISPTLQKQIVTTIPRTISTIKTVHFSNTATTKDAKNPDNNQQNLKIDLSDSCQRRLEEICKNGMFLRITVEGGGCSGFQYKFELDKKTTEDDLSFGKENAKVVIDSVSLEYCTGSTVDYHTELIRSGFRIVANPKAEQACSCGSSFAIKLD